MTGKRKKKAGKVDSVSQKESSQNEPRETQTFVEPTTPSPLPEGDLDSSGDDLLPSPFKRQRPDNSLQKGDLIFAKFGKFPYWPALFHSVCSGKPKKAKVYFFESDTLDNKKTLSVKLTSIKPFCCEQKDQYIEKGKTEYQDFCSGLERAQDYLQKRAMGKIDDFFIDIEENEDGVSDIESEEESSEKVKEESVDEKEENACEPSSQPRLASIIDRMDRKSKRKQREKGKPFYDWIISNGKDFLGKLMKGDTPSQRNKWFLYGTQQETDQLKHMSGYGPLSFDDDIDKLMDLLSEWHTEFQKDTCEYNSISYIHDVLLPEVIIESIRCVNGISRNEAENLFLSPW